MLKKITFSSTCFKSDPPTMSSNSTNSGSIHHGSDTKEKTGASENPTTQTEGQKNQPLVVN